MKRIVLFLKVYSCFLKFPEAYLNNWQDVTDDIDAGALIHNNPLNRCSPALRNGHILPYKQAIVVFLCSIARI